MTWTYDETLALPRDHVRLLIGDTDGSDRIVSDEAIAVILAANNDDVNATAASLARTLAAKYGRLAKVTIEGFTIDYEDRRKFYLDLAGKLEGQSTKAAGRIGAPLVSGVSRDAMAGVRSNTDRPRDWNDLGQGTDPGAGYPPEISRSIP